MRDALVAVKKIFPGIERVIQLYGISEAGIVCTDARVPYGVKPGSVGVANAGVVLKVVDLNKEPLGPNQRGEVCVKSPSVISGYLGIDNSGVKDEEGFYKTGDLGYYDKDRCFYIVDRIKELIKFNDSAIAPAEFEAILEQHPSVLEAGVVGAPHALHGQAPLAFVVLRPRAAVTEQEVVDHVSSQVSHKRRLAGGIRFVSSLPRGAGDKLDRKALKQMLND